VEALQRHGCFLALDIRHLSVREIRFCEIGLRIPSKGQAHFPRTCPSFPSWYRPYSRAHALTSQRYQSAVE